MDDFPIQKECWGMTAIMVFAALIVANVVYSVYDSRRTEAARQIDDFYRVEFKKSYVAKNGNNATLESWY